MEKRYFRKKDPAMFETTKEWIEMTGAEFYAFVQDPANKGRKFMNLGDVILECTEEQLRKHRLEMNHSDYLRRQEDGWVTFSLEEFVQRGGQTSGDALTDDAQDVELLVFHRMQQQALRRALFQLTEAERALLEAIFLSDNPSSVRQVAARRGISDTALNKQLKKIFRKVVSILEKSQQ